MITRFVRKFAVIEWRFSLTKPMGASRRRKSLMESSVSIKICLQQELPKSKQKQMFELRQAGEEK